MRILLALTVFAIACGPAPKKQSAIVNDESAPTCCCKTVPTTAEKEIIPVYANAGRMECSGQHGDCVDDVQCEGQAKEGGTDQAPSNDGVPPPPALEPSTTSGGI